MKVVYNQSMSNFQLFFLIFAQSFLACELQIILIGKHFSVFFSLVFFLFSRYNICKKNVGETKGFFCFSLNKRTAKKTARKVNVFCIRYSRKRRVNQ